MKINKLQTSDWIHFASQFVHERNEEQPKKNSFQTVRSQPITYYNRKGNSKPYMKIARLHFKEGADDSVRTFIFSKRKQIPFLVCIGTNGMNDQTTDKSITHFETYYLHRYHILNMHLVKTDFRSWDLYTHMGNDFWEILTLHTILGPAYLYAHPQTAGAILIPNQEEFLESLPSNSLNATMKEILTTN